MNNTLSYSEVYDLCERKKIKIKDLCESVGMTYQGLKTSLETGKLSSDKVALLCKLLSITPNQFFQYPEQNSYLRNHVEQTGMVNMQNVQYGLDIIKEQLSIKDQQISSLLTILNK